MKKLLIALTIITSLFLGSTNSFAALSASIVWEVRLTGASANGGGFKSGASGTDYSQQNAAQVAYTDLVIGNPTTTDLTSAANPFTAVAVGNIINITGGTGFTTGRYEVVSVAGNVATMDRAVGTAGSTSGTGNLGGAVVSPNNIASTVVAGNTIWIKSGSYNETWTLSVDGTTANPIAWKGYNLSRGDNPTGTDRPLVDGQSVRANCIVVTDVNINEFWYLRFANATGDGISQANGTGGNTKWYWCKSSNNGGAGASLARDHRLYFCEINNNSNKGVVGGNIRSREYRYNYVHDNTSNGFYHASGGNEDFYYNIIETNTGHGIFLGGGVNTDAILGNIIYNNTGVGTDGINDSNANPGQWARYWVNNISINNGRYGFNQTANQILFFNYNLYSGNGTAGLNNITAGANDVTTAPSFTDIVNGDFTYASGSSGIGVGFPSSMPGAIGTYKWNIGIDQDDNVTGGGETFTGTKFNRGFN